MNATRSRYLVALVSVAVVSATFIPTASADTKSQLEAAKASLAGIDSQVRVQQAALDALSEATDAVAARVTSAEGSLEAIRAEVASTREAIAIANARLETLNTRLGGRARAIFIQGPGTGLEFLLGAATLVDLADRLEYSAAVAQADNDLATAVANLRNQLDGDLDRQQELMSKRAAALQTMEQELSSLQAKFEEQRRIIADIAAKRADAERIVGSLSRKYQAELAALVPPAPSSSGGSAQVGGIFQACPVGEPRGLTDSFGAPRYGGGYHLHAGNDIMAPEGTPIYATFSGTAEDASNTLGGLSVRVIGSQGWTYNAHMSEIGSLGAVSAGSVIGYVGATGDTSTPHNHFEWHPDALPSGWPASAYSYSVIGDAVNPYPILAAVC